MEEGKERGMEIVEPKWAVSPLKGSSPLFLFGNLRTRGRDGLN
jgi:hypothetical protein